MFPQLKKSSNVDFSAHSKITLLTPLRYLSLPAGSRVRADGQGDELREDDKVYGDVPRQPAAAQINLWACV